MNKKRLIVIFLVIVLIAMVSCFILNRKILVNNNQNLNTTPTAEIKNIEYKNDQYGFDFSLPLSWNGYSIVLNKWNGQILDAKDSTEKASKIEGPEIFIRHPQWTKENPRQDIPIMVFTMSQWDLILKEKLAVSAAPIGPSELGRNSKYIFALPARYNFAFLAGFEEVEDIIKNHPLIGQN
jgi:hypothetical protein